MICISLVRASTLAQAICGVMKSRRLSWILISGFFSLIGSADKTSRPAAAIFAIYKCVVEILFNNDRTTAEIQEDTGFFHLCKCAFIQKIFGVFIQWCMDRDNIRSGKQGIEINLRISILCRASGG